MVKKKVISILLGLVIVIGAISGGFIYYLSINKKTQTESLYVRIYVNSTIYDSIFTEINQYKQGIINQGHSVDVINWSSTSVITLKSNINDSYYNNGLNGVIFIGEIPYLLVQHWDVAYGVTRSYPSDLFLMDLDGSWTYGANGLIDIDQNEHTNGTGDWTPEIWLARINPNSIDVPNFNYTNAYKDYFSRNNKFRNGETDRSHKALLYIDDDWSDYKDEWLSNFTAYTGSEVDCYYDDPTTTANYYMNNITNENYEFVHLLAHSWAHQHQFGPNGDMTEGVVTCNDLYTNTTTALFYNLYACFSCNFDQKNNTGTYYLFSPNVETLTVIGSARDGGLDLYQPFYDALKEGKPIGEAFRIWFHNPEIIKLNKEQLYHGMTIFGDPLLTIYMT